MTEETTDAQRAQLRAMLGEIRDAAETLRATAALGREQEAALVMIEHSTSELLTGMEALLAVLRDRPPKPGR